MMGSTSERVVRFAPCPVVTASAGEGDAVQIPIEVFPVAQTT